MTNKKELYQKAHQWHRNNRTVILRKAKEYYLKHKEEILRKAKTCQHKNLDLIKRRCYIKKYQLTHKLQANCRSRLRMALKGRAYKIDKTFNLIGCTPKELKVYLESKFQPGMTWDNNNLYGWHIDHIIPCARFDLTKESEQRKCFHYSNLQPLWATENRTKGVK